MDFEWIKLVFFFDMCGEDAQKNSPWSGGYFFYWEWVMD